MLSTDQKGAIAEAEIVAAAAKCGIAVYKPVSGASRADLIFDVGTRLLRVQCKSAARRGDVVIVRCYSCRRARTGVVRRLYTTSEIDAVAAYCHELDRCYFLPFERFALQAAVQLRLAPTRNNQFRRVVWARDFEFESLHFDPDHVRGP